MNWFTVEQLSTDTYVISEYLHREQTHCYLLLGTRSALLIDTGLGVADLRPVVETLTSLPVQVVTTHAHWDHIGSHGSFSNIAVHHLERDWISGSFPLPLEMVRKQLWDENCTFPTGFHCQDYALYTQGATAVFTNGTPFDLGGRVIEALHTPGHAPGHCCFWEPARGWLYSGDLIYAGTLDAFYPTTDPRAFARSVQRIHALPVSRVLPGHFTLDISPTLIARITDAFHQLDAQGLLCHGAGLFPFDDFQIHL